MKWSWVSVSILVVLISGLSALYLLVFPISQTVNVTNISSVTTVVASSTVKTALFANGCFWCAEADFEKLRGVASVVSGYADGTGGNPTYEDYGKRGFREVVEVTYDPTIVTYAQLVEHTIKHGDPTDGGGSFYDRGYEYSPGVYFETEEEKRAAEETIASINLKKVFNKPIALTIMPRAQFWPAEEYHQDYYKKNPVRYAYYRNSSGRDAFIEKYWGADTLPTPVARVTSPAVSTWETFVKPSDKVLRSTLTALQYNITQEGGTEPAFKNEYDKNKAEGIYVDVVSGEPLFSSIDKFDSGTGWPSFVKPLVPENIVLKEDRSLFFVRTEVRSKHGDSHLGHVFNDGPQDRGGLRYCMNSAALRFVSKDKLIAEGYAEFTDLFNNQ